MHKHFDRFSHIILPPPQAYLDDLQQVAKTQNRHNSIKNNLSNCHSAKPSYEQRTGSAWVANRLPTIP